MKNLLKITLASIFLTLSSLIICLLFFIKPISETAIHHAGFPNASIGSVSVNLKNITLKNITLDENNKISTVQIFIPISTLLTHRLGGVTIEGAEIYTDPTKKSGGNFSSAKDTLEAGLRHLNAFSMTDSLINIMTPQGLLPVHMDGNLLTQGNNHQWKSSVTAEAPFTKLNGHLTVTLDKGTGTIKSALEINESRLTIPGLEVKRLEGWISADLTSSAPPALNGQMTAGVLKVGKLTLQDTALSLSTDAKKPQLLLTAQAPNNAGDLTLSGMFDTNSNKGTLDFQAHIKDKVHLNATAKIAFDYDPTGQKLRFMGTATPDPALPPLKIYGSHDVSANKGDISLYLPPFSLKPGGAQLTDLLPQAKDYIQDASGDIGMTAHIVWTKTGLATEGDLLLKQVSGTVKGSAISGLNTVLHFDSLLPPSFKNQTVAIGLLDAGLPLTQGLMTLSLNKSNNLTLHNASWAFAKGTITSSPFTISLNDLNTDITLTAQSIDLIDLFKLAPTEGLDATGTVNGTLPLQIRNGNASIVNGVLETTGPGSIRYSPKQVPLFLQDTSKKQIVDLRLALKAFDYESLKLILNGEAGKTQKISLQAKGKNPEFYKGHAVSLNFNVEGPLQSVIKYNPGGSQIPDNILKQLNSYERDHAQP
jgi:hypothetical protein